MIRERYDIETQEKIDFYLDEIERQGKLKFLGFFPAPNSIYFIPLTVVLFMILEFVSRLYFIPSLISLYLIFERLAYGGYMVKLAENCVVEEIFMENELQNDEGLKNEMLDLGFPLCVTLECKVEIVERIVMETKHPNFFQRIRENRYTFLIVAATYLVMDIIIFRIKY